MSQTLMRRGLGVCVFLSAISLAAFPARAQDEVAQLKEQLARQQEQIEELRRALDEQRRMLERTLAALEAAGPGGPSAGLGGTALPGPGVDSRFRGNDGQEAPSEVAQSVGEVELVRGELDALAEHTAQSNERLAKVETAMAENQKKTEGRLRGLGNFNFSGDVRLRYEPFFQEGRPDRHRERARARLNLTGKLTDEIAGGVSLATGALDDLDSTNQSFTGFLTRKPVGLDRYFIQYRPRAFKPLTLVGGKFAFPWYRTPLTFDSDINPEGFAQTFSFDLKNPLLKNLTFVGFQLPIHEVSGGPDSFILGGQVQTQWRLAESVNLRLYAAGINFNRVDPMAVAIADGSLRPSLANTNALRTDADGNVTGFASRFAYLDLIGRLDYAWSSRWPMMLQFNFVNNTRAATSERSGYWADIAFGQLRETRDIQFGYSWVWIEREAVIGAFNESDLRSATNVRNHRVLFGYQTHPNVTAQWTMWLGKLRDPFQNTSLIAPGVRSNCTTEPFVNCRDSMLNRMQFDLIYKF
jgi:hypothetical protein